MKALTILSPVFFMILLGFTAKVKRWITPEQKAGANAIIFRVLFPIMVFNLMLTVSVEKSSLLIISYVTAVYIFVLAAGRWLSGFAGKEYAHFAHLLLVTSEGGNVALPLFLSIVGSSSLTVIFDIPGSITCFIMLPILVAKLSSSGITTKKLLKNIFSNSFVLAVILGLVLNLSGVWRMIQGSAFFDLYTSVINQATAPIVGMILFILGYDLSIDKETIGPILRLVAVRVVFYVLVIAGFFLLFPTVMQDKLFQMAVIIYFMSPTGFGLLPVISPL